MEVRRETEEKQPTTTTASLISLNPFELALARATQPLGLGVGIELVETT